MKGEIGYEHYFINYYLYLPFSTIQEEVTVKETIKIMHDLGVKKFNNSTDFEIFLKDIQSLYIHMENLSSIEVEKIKNNLKLNNSKRVELIISEIESDYKNIFPNYINIINNIHKTFFHENDKKFSNIIHSDYKHKNENVEVYLHQRTMKKVKYKKREYPSIHIFNKNLINKLIEHKEEIWNEIKNSQNNYISDNLLNQIKILNENF
jgi:hypothetical protein